MRADELDQGIQHGMFWAATAYEARRAHRIAREEIFGPVATFIRIRKRSRSDRAGKRSRLRTFGKRVVAEHRPRQPRCTRALRTGTVAINTPYAVFPGVPFGGYKQSGYGRELGMETMRLYTETKSVLTYIGEKPINPFGV